MNNEPNMIIEKVGRLKEGINKEFLTLTDSEIEGLKEWSSNEDDLIIKYYVYGYLLDRSKLILDIEETLYLLQQCSSTLMFISYGITEECFYEKDISYSILLLENNLSNSVKRLSSILGFND